MTSTDRFDVAIVGAGPAGCRAAWRMAKAGARVAMFDGSHPREKPCGGGVTGRALEFVHDAVEPRAFTAVAIQTATFAQGALLTRMAIAGPAADPPRLVIASRREFDSALLAAAVAAGVCLIPARVLDVTPDGGGWAVATRDGIWRAGWLLGADGPNSLVRRRVLQPFARADLSIATGFFVHGATSREIAIAFEEDPPGYLWSFPRHDHLAVGVCAQADVTSVGALLPIASRWIARHATGTVRLERYSWPIPSLRAATLGRERPAGPGWMLLGDAGGMVDPITREGIFFALISGDAAAGSLLAGGDCAAEYTRRIRAAVHSELIRAARLKAHFFTPRFTRLLLHGLERSEGIRGVMADLISGRQPYHGLRRRLLSTFEVSLMVDFLRLKAEGLGLRARR
ncbi:MAG: NAD(P)/FAD-dependent oxidoreductase [Acidobacteriota bacterium]